MVWSVLQHMKEHMHIYLTLLLTPEDFADDKWKKINLSICQMKHHTIRMHDGLEV
jgi:hypothetical protein